MGKVFLGNVFIDLELLCRRENVSMDYRQRDISGFLYHFFYCKRMLLYPSPNFRSFHVILDEKFKRNLIRLLSD